MNSMDNLRSLVIQQKDILSNLENEVKAIENSDIIKENEKLKAELEALSAQYERASESEKTLTNQNINLKNALHEQVYSEKVRLVDSSQARLAVFFGNGASELDRLTNLESIVRQRITDMLAALRKHNIDANNAVYFKLEELATEVNQHVTKAQQLYAENSGAFSVNEKAQFDALRAEQINDEQIIEISKKNNMERFVGLKLVNIAGILLILIGVITAAHYTYTHLTDVLKGVMMFSLGTLMLIAGEIMNRKKPSFFSLGITAGGVAILYSALAISYFGLEIIGMYPALGLCVLITAAAFFLSVRYNSQVILAFALIGGYLPLFSSSMFIGTVMIYGVMVYFILLNLLALLVSFHKKWATPTIIGLILNILGTFYLSFSTAYNATSFEKSISILYILFAFLNYTLIPIISTYRTKLKFRNSDIVLLAGNTLASSLIIFMQLYRFDLDDFTGLASVIFAAIYLSLGFVIERKMSGEKHTRALFYITGLAFVILTIPFQFGEKWLSLGWLAQGVGLSVYGIIKSQKNFRRAGFIINLLALITFLNYDFWWSGHLFAWKYLAITAASLIILVAYALRGTLASGYQKFHKCVVIINLWVYSGYISYKLYELINPKTTHNIDYLIIALAITLTLILAYTVPRIKRISDTSVKVISCIMYFVGILSLFGLNGAFTPYYDNAETVIKVVGTGVLVLISLFACFAVYDLVKLFVVDYKLGVGFLPLIVSAYFVVNLTQILIAQYNLSFASAWISVIYVLTALAWIIFGFARRYSFIRKFGLGLALASVAKLFIIDLAQLTQGYRIISYFALGVTLVAISFVYQLFNKRLELKTEVSKIEESTSNSD